MSKHEQQLIFLVSGNNRPSYGPGSIVVTQYIMHKETPESGTVSSVAYQAWKVSIDSSIIQVPYEATGTVGN